MRAASARLLSLLAAATASGCATNSAPPEFLPSPKVAQYDAYGGWIELSVREGSRERRVEGELLAVTVDSVWVLTEQGARAIATATVLRGKLTGYASGAGSVAGYTALGVLSTASNGVLLVLTAPLWVITGSIAASGQSHVPERAAPPLAWPDLAMFARFPQGFPDGVAASDLRLPSRRRGERR